ncbi:MAG TPA: Hsp20/alpha crystallin family protein [Bacteriovoracaceae bacterium]|nr:Hsp20/alpha crystallin family protein [Bacteriovoracaceae bacterium]
MSLFNKNSSLTPIREQHPWSLWQREMSNLFDRFNRDFGSMDEEFGSFYPKIEMKEEDKKLIVCAEVPGMNEKDVNVTLKDNHLILQGERKSESKSEEGGTHRSEFRYGSFYRSIPLSQEVKEDSAKASYKDGLLTIEFEKSADSISQTKKIPITRS